MSLVTAIIENDETEIDRRISEGANVNQRSNLGLIPLCEAARAGSVKIATKLIKAGADINSCDARGFSPLRCAVYPGGNLEMVNLLINLGAQVNKQTSLGEKPSMETPAHVVFFHDSYSILIHLIRNGADLTLKNASGQTPLEMGQFVNPHSTCVKILEKVTAIKNSNKSEAQKSEAIELFLKKTENERTNSITTSEFQTKKTMNPHRFMGINTMPSRSFQQVTISSPTP